MSLDCLSLEQVQKARSRLSGVIHVTPLDYSALYSRITGCNLYLKLENLQKTGSFKIRGAFNKIAALSGEERTRGVIAASAGNHAQGVAYAASRAGIKSIIVMPEGAPLAKIAATRSYGAEVILSGKGYDEAYQRALEVQRETGATFIHGFNDPDIIAGQGTIALELLEQLKDLEAVVVPVGGGGLLAGISLIIKLLKPNIKVFGVQARGAPAVYLSRKSERLEELREAATIADGICVRCPGSLNMEVIRQYVDDILLVDDEEISETILMLLERSKVMAEGAGAVGLAALLSGHLELKGLNVAVIISGGNIDINVLSNIIERGLIKSGRRLRIKTVIPDRPGSLMKLLSLLASCQANVIFINHDRTRPQVPIRQAEVELAVETENREHLEKIVDLLTGSGYKVEIL